MLYKLLPVIYLQVCISNLAFVLTNTGDNASKKNKDGECEEAFSKLKEICTSNSILVYAIFLNHSNSIAMHVHSDGN